MRSMSFLRGMPPKESLKNEHSEIEVSDNFK